MDGSGCRRMKRTGKRTWRVGHFRGKGIWRVGDRGQVVWGRGDRDFGAEGIERMGKRTCRVGHIRGELTGRIGDRGQAIWGRGIERIGRGHGEWGTLGESGSGRAGMGRQVVCGTGDRENGGEVIESGGL